MGDRQPRALHGCTSYNVQLGDCEPLQVHNHCLSNFLCHVRYAFACYNTEEELAALVGKLGMKVFVSKVRVRIRVMDMVTIFNKNSTPTLFLTVM